MSEFSDPQQSRKPRDPGDPAWDDCEVPPVASSEEPEVPESRSVRGPSAWQIRFDGPAMMPGRSRDAAARDDSGSGEFMRVPREMRRSDPPPRPRVVDGEELRRAEEAPSGDFLGSRVAWWGATLTVLVAGWLIGPALIERYSYARTRGEMMAQYDIAKTALEGDPARSLSLASQWVSQKVRPSVAHIRTFGPELSAFGEPRLDTFTEGQGSAVVLSADGYLMTNQHVVMDATEIWVTLFDRRVYPAELIGTDRESDLALLKIDETGLVPIEWSGPDDVEVGSLVWAIGSPYGLEQSTTQGIVSAMHRRKGNGLGESLHQDLLQSDVAINPGNSGGPLVDSRGRLVGINTSIVGEAFCGISFAVPATVAREVSDRLRLTGRVDRGFLGVVPQVVPGHLVKQYGITEGKGAYIDQVVPGRAADRAGIRAGDVVLTWDGKAVDNDVILFRLVGLTPVNSTVTVTLLRDGVPMELQVKVDGKADRRS